MRRITTSALVAILCTVAVFTLPGTAYASDGNAGTVSEAAYESEQDFLDTLNEVLSGDAKDGTFSTAAAENADDENNKEPDTETQPLSGSITIHSGPDDSYSAICTLDEDTIMKVTGSICDWLLVEDGFVSGYVDAAKVSTTTEDGYSTEEAIKQTEARIAAKVPERVKITASILTIRRSASTSSLALGYIPSGAVVAVESAEGDWYKVTYGSTTGYISSDYAKETDDAVTAYVAVSNSSSSTSTSSSSTGSVVSTSSSKSGAAVLAYAKQFVGNPYVWGGTSLTNGCDCSGFVKSVYAHFGVSLPHSSYSLRSVGKAVSVSNMQVGDIVCYSGHVGIYAGNGKLLSALGRKYGITYCSVNYKTILAVRRIF